MMSIYRFIKFLYSLYLVSKNEKTDKIDNKINITNLIKNTKKSGIFSIKLLQFILMRENIKNKDLEFVFEDCPRHSFEETKELYLNDFGHKMEDDFILEDNIIASGSIGQVYKLYSKSQNKFIALKSKHPNVDKNIHNFIKIIKISCYIFYYFNKYHNIILEYINNIELQLDYGLEANNTILFKKKWKSEPCVVIPEIYTFSNNFICMSYHEGKCYNSLEQSEKQLASLYINFILLSSILIHDFIHMDLHVGNWKVISSGDEVKILMYDCGIMCATNQLETNKLIVANLLGGNFDKLASVLIDIKNLNKSERIKADEFILFIKNNLPICPIEKTCFFLNNLINTRLVSNKKSINILTAFAIIGQNCTCATNLFVNYIGAKHDIHQCLIYIYIGLLVRVNKFSELKNYLQDWMDSDPLNDELYSNWMIEKFGHKKKYILDDIIYNKIKFVKQY